MARNIGSRYVAHKVLGRGASGTVWRGEGPDGPVAIKLLREDLACDQELVARFVQERTALTSLEHRNIVGIHELVVDGADLALVMDLVEGHDLRTRLEREKVLTPALAVTITADVADALAAAHAEGLIHRDVKPENVLLDERDGELSAKLTDFGIARLVDSPRRTRATRIIGTPDYLAPEIIEGCRPTAAVDVYALGTVCYELLTGWTPFGYGHPGAVLRRHVTEAVPGIPGLPEPLAAVLSSCLSKAPAARLTAAEMSAALRELLPSVVGMPPFDAPDPHTDEDDEYEPRPARATPVPAARRREPLEEAARSDLGRAEPAEEPVASAQDERGRDRDLPRERSPHARPPAGREETPALSDSALAAGAVPLVPPAGDGFVRRSDLGAYSRQTHLGLRRPDPSELAGEDERGGQRRRVLIGVAAALLALMLLGYGGYLLAARHSSAGGAQPVGAATKLPDSGRGQPAGGTASAPPATMVRSLSWSAASPLPSAPETLVGGAQAAAMPGGPEYVFCRGVSGDLWYVSYDGTRYGDWQRLGGLRSSFDPAVVATAGRLEVFAVGLSDSALWQRVMSAGAWGRWNRLTAKVRLTQAPAAAAQPSGQIEVVARTTGDTLVAGALAGGTWQDFSTVTVAGRITAAPALAAGDGSLDAFVAQAGDGALLRISYSGGVWQHPLAVGGETYSRPAAARLADGRLVVVSRSAAGKVQAHMLIGAGWQVADVAVDTPAAPALAGSGARADLFARTSATRLVRIGGA